MSKPSISVLTGAGISAESGIQTFRGQDGLWRGHEMKEIASPQGWEQHPQHVLNFYNARRRQLRQVQPNAAHRALVSLEKHFAVNIITQNVDDLHERAGSQQVTHLHGELFKARSTHRPDYVIDWKTNLQLGDCDPEGYQLRPHVVWFGEAVPAFETAATLVRQTELFIIIGTSLQVYPAAGLINYLDPTCPIYLIDPNPTVSSNHQLKLITKKATVGVPELVNKLIY